MHLILIAFVVGVAVTSNANAASAGECAKLAGDLKGESRKEFIKRCTHPESIGDAPKAEAPYVAKQPKTERVSRDSGSTDGYYWSVIGATEKAYIARMATQTLGGTYPPIEMAACLQAFYKRPAPENILRQEIAAIAIGCHGQLR